MTEHDILDAIGDIDPAYLEEARRKPVPIRLKWAGIGSLAACLLLLIIFPFHARVLKMAESGDFAPAEGVECSVYFVRDNALYYESANILGGDAEMFETWARKNGMKETMDLKSISFDFIPREDGLLDVTVTVSSSLSHYFEGNEGDLLLDSLKRTVASYRDIEIGSLSVVYS